jgi:hypothetical protein
MKIYLVQHQANGVVHEFPFSSPPSEAQLEAVWTFCFQSHGASHSKTPGEPYWQIVKEVEVLGPNDIPVIPARGLSVVSTAAAGEFGVSGVGTVTPKAG